MVRGVLIRDVTRTLANANGELLKIWRTCLDAIGTLAGFGKQMWGACSNGGNLI